MGTLQNLRTSPNYRWIILISTTLSQTAVSFCSQGMQPLGPYFKDSFKLSAFQVGVMVTMMELGMFFTLLVAGRIVDLYGERRVLTLGGIGCGILMILASFSGSFFAVCGLLFLAGGFSASSVPGGSKAVMSWFPLSSRGFAMGVRQTGIPLGGALAALILPLLAHDGGWSLALVGAGLVANLGSLVFFGTYRDYPAPIVPESFAQTPSPKPSRMRDIIKSRDLMLLSIAGAIVIIGQYTLVIYIAFYLNEELGVPLLVTGSFLAVIHFSGAAGRIVWGIVSDRLFGGRRRGVLLLVCSMAVIMSLLTAGLNSDLPYWLIYMLLGLFGFAVVGWTGMWVALISELAGRNQSGTALGFSMTIMQVGKVCGPPLIGLCHDLTHSYRPGWLILSAILALGTYIFYLVKENRVD